MSVRIPKTSRGRLLALATDVLLQLKRRHLTVQARNKYCYLVDASLENGPLQPVLRASLKIALSTAAIFPPTTVSASASSCRIS
jgi:hypothetical protein